MNDKTETKEKLLAAAKQEFLEKGYQKASLRSICRAAGVTTGALYFFFKDKEDLFGALVEQPLQNLLCVMQSHYQKEINGMSLQELKGDITDDLAAAHMALSAMYEEYDIFDLIITKSQGSRYEYSVEQFIEISEKHYTALAKKMAEQYQVEEPNPRLIHWIAHMQVDAFVYLMQHAKTKEDAMRDIEPMMRYMIVGWIDMFQKNNELL